MQESACLQDRWTAGPLPWQQLEKFDSSARINERSSTATKWDNTELQNVTDISVKKNWQVGAKYLKSFELFFSETKSSFKDSNQL